jgi:predicted AAA+ superfamily ATPase
MRHIVRHIQKELLKAARHFPAIILTGPRRAGKTTLLRALYPKATHVLLEDPDVIARVRSDPNGFLDEVGTPVVLDEIQNTPELFRYIRSRIDRNPRKTGSWFITGSQEAPLMKGVTESMAGRAALFQLLPFSLSETSKVTMFRGGYPEVISRPASADVWFRSYIQTYLERDVRAVSSIRDLSTFRRFLSLLASRSGQMLNKAELAAPLGVSVHTISEWTSILEVTGQIVVVPPFYDNFGKRLVKSPKIYFVDSGLACHLLGVESTRMLNRSVFLGAIFESFVASEIVKLQLGMGKAKALYYFRDSQGLEVDFVVPLGEKRLAFLEAKASQTLVPGMAQSMVRLAHDVRNYKTASYVVGQPRDRSEGFQSLRPGVQTVTVKGLGSIFKGLDRSDRIKTQ